MGRPVHFMLSSLFIATIFSIFLLYSPKPLIVISKNGLDPVLKQQEASSPMQDHDSVQKQLDQDKPHKSNFQKKENCDLSKGHWIREPRGSYFYTNSSCATIPNSKNCFKHGRMDKDFLNWRWKPDQCELPRFDAKSFLQIVQGKTMAFIGDSVARNHMESLLCLLSQEEIPEDIYKDSVSDDRFRTWYFPRSDFTLKVLWTKFLIAGEERMINGTASGIYDLQLDKVDDGWAKHLLGVDYAIVSSGHWFFRILYLHEGDNVVECVYCNEPNVTGHHVEFAVQMSFRATFNYINDCAKHLLGVDYAIVSSGHWFFRILYLHEGDNVVECVYCNEPNVTGHHVEFAVQMSFRATFNYINDCKNCSGLVTLLRTFAPAHYEHGAWNTGGYCNRTGPFNETHEIDIASSEWKVRNAQIEEVERARKVGKNQGKRFGVLDVTRAMLMRPDGHPGEHYNEKWLGGAKDCVHWCMPGPVDTWSEIFMAVLRNQAGLSS